MSALALVLAVAAMATPIEIATDSDCPSTAAIRTAVAALIPPEEPPGEGAGTPITVRVQRDGDGHPDSLVVEIGWNSGQRKRSQRIAVGLDCGARAEAAAVAVASWLGRLPGSSAQPPAIETEPLPTPSATPVAVAAKPSPATPPGRPAPFRSLLGAGVGIAAGGDIATALRLEWTGARETTGFSWSLAAFGSGPRDLSLGPATSRWLRPGLELAGRGLWRIGSLLAVAQVGVMGTVTFARGSGYPIDRRSAAASAGATTALRLEAATGSWRPWLELRARVWPTSQRLRYVDATTGQSSLANLPASELLATVGTSFLL